MEGCKKNTITKTFLVGVASAFIVLANLITVSNSFFLWGETKCPKSLLK
ncbi:cyclic lactone autoinducer peptide [Natranaerovirga hydrolytica]|uniref:Cyclic lactone autoinducer peptide n=1 Tax=Natranaerovirga hydrolytica TaxID=680378 RepID=A0A4R1N0Z1_9FIRM|nr:cyclic lactone autoinducer peptide [Natranaerovirga hydrolytica]TCK98572.1 cyclic lactone autoinducer peptide [Natranaerovirga hydrolytica]